MFLIQKLLLLSLLLSEVIMQNHDLFAPFIKTLFKLFGKQSGRITKTFVKISNKDKFVTTGVDMYRQSNSSRRPQVMATSLKRLKHIHYISEIWLYVFLIIIIILYS